MAKTPEVPSWLLNDLFMTTGTFNETRTAVSGQPSAHLQSVLDTGSGRPYQVTLQLNEDQKTRLENSLKS